MRDKTTVMRVDDTPPGHAEPGAVRRPQAAARARVPRGLTTGARHAGGGLVRDVVLVLLLFGLGGLVGGALWRWLWTPASGTVFDGVWYPATNTSRVLRDRPLRRSSASASGWCLGVLSALVTDRRELLTLGLVVVGLAARGLADARWSAGSACRPTRPSWPATTANRTELPGTLAVRGVEPARRVPDGRAAGAVRGLHRGLPQTRSNSRTRSTPPDRLCARRNRLVPARVHHSRRSFRTPGGTM